LKTPVKINLKIKLLSFFWLVMVVSISPILIILAIRTKKITLRLPEATGEPYGCCKPANSSVKQNLIFIGESPVAGVGVETYQQSIAAQAARHLSEMTETTVCWRAIGKNGITIEKTIDSLIPKVPEQTIDYLVVMLGVNDVTSLKSLKHWHQSISKLVSKIRRFTNAPILVYSCPPLAQFPALPKPLAIAAGTRAHLFDQVTQHHPLNNIEFKFSQFKANIVTTQFAADGYHPSEAGCIEMGKRIATDLMALKR
jgi:lysophospholipase L1-like esterase